LGNRPVASSQLFPLLALLLLARLTLPALAAPEEWVEADKWREPGGPILTVAASPDGESIVTGAEDGTVRLRNVLTGKNSALRGHTDAVNDVAYDPTGAYLVSASKDRTLRVWDVDRRRIRLEIRGTRSAATAVAIDGENNIIISGGSDNVVRFFDANSGGKLREYGVRGRVGVVTDILIDVSGAMALVSGGPFDWTSIRIHGLATTTGAYLGERYITAKDGAINAAIARSDDGNTFAAGGEAGVLTVWAPGVSARASTGHIAAIRGVAVSPAGDLIATCSDDETVRLWEASSGSELAVLEGHSKAVNDVAFGAVGDWLVSVGSDRVTRLWRRDTSGAPLAVQPEPAAEPVAPQDEPPTPTVAPSPTPRLRLSEADISLRTPIGDGVLEAESTADLNIRVHNDGDGAASGFQIAISPPAIPHLVYVPRLDVPDVLPGAFTAFSVSIRATAEITTAAHELQISVRDADGVLVASSVYRLATRQRPEPSLTILDYATTDDNGVTPGETTTASITIRNEGSGPAADVSVSLIADTADVTALPSSAQQADGPNVVRVGALSPASSVSVSFLLAPPRTLTGVHLPVRIIAREAAGSFGVDERVVLPVWEAPAPSLTVVEAQLRDADPDGVLVAGEPASLRIQVANEGSAVAPGVRVVVSPPSLPGLMYMASVFVGDIAAGASEAVTLPIGALEDVQGTTRTLTLVAVDADGARSQPADLSFETQPPPEPELLVAAVLVDGSEAGVIAAGSVHTIEVSLTNNGTGDAEGVRVTVVALGDRQASEVAATGVPVDTVAPGGTASFTFAYAAPGGLAASSVALRVNATERREQYGIEDYRTVTVRQPKTRLVSTHALLVGVNQYDNHADLVNPVGDIQAVAAELTEAYGATVEALDDPTRHDFLTALYALADREYDEADELIVMFSGHGWYDERLKRGFLAFRDSAALDEDPFYDTYVSHENLRTVIERLACKHVLLVVDSCFSGTLDPTIAMAPGARPVNEPYGLVPRDEYVERKLRHRTRRYITAGGREYVPDGRPGYHSPFVRQVLEALRSYGGGDGILTLEEMLLYLDRVTPEPRSGELYGNDPGSSFVLVAQATEARDEPEPPTLGTVVITVSPPDARVAIEGTSLDYSGLSRSLLVVPAASRRRYQLPVGVYGLRVMRDGYATEHRELRVTVGSSELAVTLRR